MEEVKLMVFGGREFQNYEVMKAHILAIAKDMGPDKGISIVSGMARGADKLAVRIAEELGAKIYKFPADWNQYGKRAGFLRNTQMAEFADQGLAFWDGKSRGTKHSIGELEKFGKPVEVVLY